MQNKEFTIGIRPCTNVGGNGKKDQIKITNQMRVCVNSIELVGSQVPLAASVALQKNVIKSNRAQGLWGRGRERKRV